MTENLRGSPYFVKGIIGKEMTNAELCVALTEMNRRLVLLERRVDQLAPVGVRFEPGAAGAMKPAAGG